MQTIELRPSRVRVVIGLICLAFVGLIFAVITLATILGKSYVGTALCGAFVAFWIWGFRLVLRRFRDPLPQVILDDEGVTDRTMPTPKFLWGSILAAHSIQMRKFGIKVSSMVMLDVTDEQERYNQLSSKDKRIVSLNRSMGSGTFFVNLTTLPMSVEEFFRAMNERRTRLGLPLLIDGIRTVPFDRPK